MDRFIFGTYRLQGEALTLALKQAFNETAIKRVDTAQLYQNERAIADVCGSVPDVRITTKVRKISSEDVTYAAIKKSLQRMGACPPHCVLLHRPMPPASWRALERAVDDGLVDQIGVSNHGVVDLKRLLSYARIKPAINQIELHPFVPDALETVRFCLEQGIEVQAHTVQARGKFFATDAIAEAAKRTGKTPSQVMMRWAYQHGAHLVVSTRNYDHLKQWTEVPTFALDKATMDRLNALATEMPHRFYAACTPVPIEDEEMASYHPDELEAFACTAAEQLRVDEQRLQRGDTVSDHCMVLPSIKGHKTSPMAERIADALYPLDLERFDGDEKRAHCSQYQRYKDLLRKLRHQVFEQRKKEAEENRKAKKNFCCLRSPISTAVSQPEPMPVDIAPASEVKPVFMWLRDTKDAQPSAALTFLRGTVFPDGRMDFCKQVTGNEHIGALCEAVKSNVLRSGFVRHFLLGNNIACKGDHVESAEAMASLMRDERVSIETWYLAGNEIGPRCIDVLSTALEQDTHAKALWLKRNPVLVEGAARLGRMLTVNRSLVLLDLHNCGLLDAGVKAFVDACGEAPLCLQHLYLDSNGITAEGGKTLAVFAARNKNVLQSLYVSINRLGDEGVLAIAGALEGSTSLKRFWTGSNGITDAAMPRLAAIVMTWTSLLALDVGYYKSTFHMGERPNVLGRDDEKGTVVALRTLIEKHPTLEYLSVFNNALSIPAVTTLAALARSINSTGTAKRISVGLVQFGQKKKVQRAQVAAAAAVTAEEKETDASENSKGDDDDDEKDVVDPCPYASIQVHTKSELRLLKHSERVVHIDSVYRCECLKISQHMNKRSSSDSAAETSKI